MNRSLLEEFNRFIGKEVKVNTEKVTRRGKEYGIFKLDKDDPIIKELKEALEENKQILVPMLSVDHPNPNPRANVVNADIKRSRDGVWRITNISYAR